MSSRRRWPSEDDWINALIVACAAAEIAIVVFVLLAIVFGWSI